MSKLKVGDKCFYLTHLFSEGRKIFFMAEGVISSLINEKHCQIQNNINGNIFKCANVDIMLQTNENVKNDYIRVRTQGRILSHKYTKDVCQGTYADFINFEPRYVGRLDCPTNMNI